MNLNKRRYLVKMVRSMLDACSVICVNLAKVNNEKLALLFGLNVFFS